MICGQTHQRNRQHANDRDRPAGHRRARRLSSARRELPAPGPGQAVVRVEATGVSFAEQQMRRGKYYDQPRVPVRARLRPGRHGRLGRARRGPAGRRRFAALTKTGGWASHVLSTRPTWSRCRRASTRPRPRRWSSTASPPGGCCTARPGSAPGRPSSCSGPTAASARRWCSWPATPGIRVIGTASARPPRRGAGSGRHPDRLPRRGRARAGARAGAGRRGRGVRPRRRPRASSTPGGCSPRGGTLVSYGTASTQERRRLPAARC